MNNDPVDCVGIRSDVTLHCTMGILNSKSSQSNLKMKEALNALHPTVHVMQLYDGDIKMIRKCFNKMDRKRDGLIYLDEFRFHLQAEDCSFTQKILKMFCCGCPEHLQFGEFLMMCWIYCTLNREKLEKFLFDLYDKDGSKILSEKNIQEFVIDLYGASYTLIPEARSAYAHIPVGTINFADFKNYLHSQPTLISNADVLQNQLRKFIVGDAFWRRLSRRRLTVPEEVLSNSFSFMIAKLIVLYPITDITNSRDKKDPTEIIPIANLHVPKIKEISKNKNENIMETLQREKKMKDKKKMKKTPYKDILNESIIDKRFFRTDRERDLANARKLCEFENANSVIITEIFPEDLVPKDRSFRAMKEKALKNVRKISI